MSDLSLCWWAETDVKEERNMKEGKYCEVGTFHKPKEMEKLGLFST